MRQWEEIQIRVWKMRVKQAEDRIEEFNWEIKGLGERIKDCQGVVKRAEKSREKMIEELEEQGWMLEGGEWVKVDDNKGSLHEGKE